MHEKYADHALVLSLCLRLLVFSDLFASLCVCSNICVLSDKFVFSLLVCFAFVYVCWFVCLSGAFICFVVFVCASLCVCVCVCCGWPAKF